VFVPSSEFFQQHARPSVIQKKKTARPTVPKTFPAPISRSVVATRAHRARGEQAERLAEPAAAGGRCVAGVGDVVLMHDETYAL
jgi:hypothetical protein